MLQKTVLQEWRAKECQTRAPRVPQKCKSVLQECRASVPHMRVIRESFLQECQIFVALEENVKRVCLRKVCNKDNKGASHQNIHTVSYFRYVLRFLSGFHVVS